jgi:hypothetical protein
MKGIVLYNIELNNCLNGVHTNDDAKGEIFNEIAKPKTKIDGNDISGLYYCAYFENNNNKVVECELKIEVKQGIYEFTWSTPKDGDYHKGIGYKMNKTQIAVSYTDVI